MTTFPAVVLVVLAGCGSYGADTADPVTLDDVARSGPVITAVTTDDGFTQLRQDATVVVVIRGRRLEQTTGVTVGVQFVLVDSVASDEVRVTVFYNHESQLGPLDVAVTSPAGTVVKPGALRLTPFVVSPTAVAGHGTFQSPINLCDAQLEEATDDSLVQLLAGTHRCDRTITILASATVAGDPHRPTIVTGASTGGFGIAIGEFGRSVSKIRDLTFAAPLADASIALEGGGDLVVERVVDTGGIQSLGNGFVTVDHYRYEGEGTAIEALSAAITSSSIRHCGSGDGIRIAIAPLAPSDGVSLDNVVVEDCVHGLIVGGPPGRRDGIATSVTNSKLIDNEIGIQTARGTTTIQDTVIRGHRGANHRASLAGISLASGDAFVSNVEITGQRDVGLSLAQRSSDGLDGQLFASGLEIVGGRVGIEFDGIDNNMMVGGSVVRGQTEASLRVSSLDGRTDVGGCTLSVVSGFAIDDQRQFESGSNRYLHLTGTTLNGVAFDGQTIEGPAELAPYYRVVSGDSGLQF